MQIELVAGARDSELAPVQASQWRVAKVLRALPHTGQDTPSVAE